MSGFFEKEGSIPGTVALVLFIGFILCIPFLPRRDRPQGSEIPSDFIGSLWRASAAAKHVVDPEKIVINEGFLGVEVVVKHTGQRFSADDLIDSTAHLEVTVLCRSNDFIVCQYGPYIFVVDNRDLIVHIATLYHYRIDGLYPCPEHRVAKPDAVSKRPQPGGKAEAIVPNAPE